MIEEQVREQSVIEQLLLGDSAAMHAVRARVARVASDTASVIVTGPSGSGKECVARAIHLASDRADRPFVAVNCGAIPRDLIESELFGHERGAFTGAHALRIGRFEQAQGGTLFLDEIGDMPLDVQVKLLRVLEERCFERVGGNRPIALDVRIVSATHRDFDAALADGSFREDLFYRLAVVAVQMPSLAARASDVPLLAAHFLATTAPRRAPVRFDGSALTRLVAHDWPGNVRELRNLVERATILHPGETLDASAIEELLHRSPQTVAVCPVTLLEPDRGIDLTAELARIEADYIRRALVRSHGVVAVAARNLGLRRTTLIEKMRRFQLGRSDPHASAIGSIAVSAD